MDIEQTDAEISALDFRTALGRFASGLTIVTGHDGDEPIGFTCQAFYSVSTNPPIVSFSVMETSTSWPRIRDTGKFAVNMLAHGQHEVAGTFARSGTDKWAGVEWAESRAGNPLIEGVLSWIDCTVLEEHHIGDHHVVFGRIQQLSPPRDEEHEVPLVYYKGKYHALA
jgi:3-hydroxy-9,10-secoandrosta-1,3,5(10)-triene-9,17-dione monooxygenase reductase component